MTTEQNKILAADAQQLLDSPVLNKAFGDFREAIVNQIEDLDLTSVEEREKLCITLQVIKNVRYQIEMYASTGQILNKEPEEF